MRWCVVFLGGAASSSQSLLEVRRHSGDQSGKLLFEITRVLRERVWQLCGLMYIKIRVNIDTTVETIYGDQQGGT